MDILDNFHIYLETCKNNQINDKNIVKPNAIFDVIKFFSNVLLSSYVYFLSHLYLLNLCVFVVLYVYCFSYFRCRTAG